MDKTNVFIDTIHIETQTVYSENGNINIYPCGFETGYHIVKQGDRAVQKGRMVTDDDGTSRFSPYSQGGGSRYSVLHRTAHGEVKETLNNVIFQLRFPKRLGKEQILGMLYGEQEEQLSFVKSRQTNIQW